MSLNQLVADGLGGEPSALIADGLGGIAVTVIVVERGGGGGFRRKIDAIPRLAQDEKDILEIIIIVSMDMFDD